MQAAIFEYIQQYWLAFLAVYSLTFIGSWRMIAINRPHFSLTKDFSFAAFPLVGLLAAFMFVYQDVRQDLQRDVPSWL